MTKRPSNPYRIKTDAAGIISFKLNSTSNETKLAEGKVDAKSKKQKYPANFDFTQYPRWYLAAR